MELCKERARECSLGDNGWEGDVGIKLNTFNSCIYSLCKGRVMGTFHVQFTHLDPLLLHHEL